MNKETNVQEQDWYKDLKIKGMVDYKGHYVEMKQVDKNQKVWWLWNDGAITNEGFKRDRLFNFLYSILKFYRLNKFIIKFFILLVIMFVLYLIIF